jgi:hypothetical protein
LQQNICEGVEAAYKRRDAVAIAQDIERAHLDERPVQVFFGSLLGVYGDIAKICSLGAIDRLHARVRREGELPCAQAQLLRGFGVGFAVEIPAVEVVQHLLDAAIVELSCDGLQGDGLAEGHGERDGAAGGDAPVDQ